MQGKKILFLFLALLLPIFVFLFLKIFGKNEFAVPPLYQNTAPEKLADCSPIKLPYKLPNKILQKSVHAGDSLGLIYFKESIDDKDSRNQIVRVEGMFKTDPISFITPDSVLLQSQACIFFMKPPFDLVLVDHHGLIRGQYICNDREDVDRLITEIDIILKKY